MPSTRPSIGSSLAAPPPAARRLDRDDVAGPDVPRHLRRKRLAVEQVAAGLAGRAAALALRRLRAALADDREPAVLEDAQLADDAVAASMSAVAAGPSAQAVALDTQRVLQLQRLDRSRERVGHRDVHAARAIRSRARTLAAADRLVVRKAVVAECDVVHRSLTLRRDIDGLPERAHDDVDDARRRLDVAGGDRCRRTRVDEAALRRTDSDRRECTAGRGDVRVDEDPHDVEAGRAGD